MQVSNEQIINELGYDKAVEVLQKMWLIRHFEQRGEQAYQRGKVWGFYHAYTGQEAIQTAAIFALGNRPNLWVTTYRCHALALLLGMTPEEGMCELYGKANGNALGRGGSMHLYTDNMYGGFGIVGGQWPIGAGLAFSLKYREITDALAICFGGDGSVMQGTFHETLNMCALWKLPLLVVIENNQLGMGTQVERAIAHLPVGENMAKAYGVNAITVDGMDFFACYSAFKQAKKDATETQKPVILEMITQRFRGHSISDPATYRTKDELQKIKERDPIALYASILRDRGILNAEQEEKISDAEKEIVLKAMEFADESPNPDPNTLGDGVIV